MNEDDAIRELLGYEHGVSRSSGSGGSGSAGGARGAGPAGSGGLVPISEEETAASAASLSAMLQRRRPGAAAQALGSLVKVRQQRKP